MPQRKGTGLRAAAAFLTFFLGVSLTLGSLWGGAAACLCLTVGTWPKLRSVVTILPFIVLMAVDGVIAVLPAYAKGKLELSPMLLVRCAPPHMNPGWLEFLALSVLTLFSLALGYWQVVKHELA